MLLVAASAVAGWQGALVPRAGRSLRTTTVAAAEEPTPLVEVRQAGAKGLGCFALEPLAAGDFVGQYEGTVTTRAETRERYNATFTADYVFNVDDEADIAIDAQNSTHFSRFFNHAEHGNLDVHVDAEAVRVEFYAATYIQQGEELTFDYGVNYWLFRERPSADTDSRNYSDPRYRERRPELSLLRPPPVGTVLPLTPLTATELQAALVLPEPESLAALLRCLEYFGLKRLERSEVNDEEAAGWAAAADEWWQVPFGVGAGAARRVVPSGAVNHSMLQDAACTCIIEAILDPTDP
eukprot:6176976-Prymnesium_polylepis.1